MWRVNGGLQLVRIEHGKTLSECMAARGESPNAALRPSRVSGRSLDDSDDQNVSAN